MRPIFRILIELFGPPLLGVVITTIVETINYEESFTFSEFGDMFLTALPVALVISAIPSICYTMLLEISYSMGLQRRSFRAILFSTLLGAFGGASCFVYIPKADVVFYFAIIGAVSAFIVSALIYFCEPREILSANY